jgi:hypothetical protein
MAYLKFSHFFVMFDKMYETNLMTKNIYHDINKFFVAPGKLPKMKLAI